MNAIILITVLCSLNKDPNCIDSMKECWDRKIWEYSDTIVTSQYSEEWDKMAIKECTKEQRLLELE